MDTPACLGMGTRGLSDGSGVALCAHRNPPPAWADVSIRKGRGGAYLSPVVYSLCYAEGQY